MTVQDLKETLTSAEASPAAKERCVALIALYSASYSYALRTGGTQEHAVYSGNFDIFLYENDDIASIEAAEKELLRLAGAA